MQIMTKKIPMLQKILPDSWGSLPSVFRAHYDVIPYCHDSVTFKGSCDYYASRWMRCLLPLFKLAPLFMPREGTQISTTVRIRTQPHSSALYFDRTHVYPSGGVYRSYTHMVTCGDREVIEYIGYGLGVRLQYDYADQTIRLHHKGYDFNSGQSHFSLPLTWLFGKMAFEKTALSENRFSFILTIRHRLFGLLFECKGIFEQA